MFFKQGYIEIRLKLARYVVLNVFLDPLFLLFKAPCGLFPVHY